MKINDHGILPKFHLHLFFIHTREKARYIFATNARAHNLCTAGSSCIVDNYPAENGNSRGGKRLDDGKRKTRYIPASQRTSRVMPGILIEQDLQIGGKEKIEGKFDAPDAM